MSRPCVTLALFPGQGAEEPRMGLALARAHPPAAALLALAGELAGVDPLHLLGRGGPALARTEVLQPLLVAVTLGAFHAAAAAGLRPALVAGHSLGELAAWSASGAITAEAAVRLAALRGRLMAAEAGRTPGAMAALADEAAVEAALAAGRGHGPLGLAARNAPDEWVISGAEAAVAAALRAVPGRRLSVAGAWHSPIMAPAVEPFRAAARALPRAPARSLLLSGVTGEVVMDEARLPDLLAEALLAPVSFTALLAEAARRGVTDVVVLGPPRVARGLARRSLGAIPVHLVCDPSDLPRIAEALAA